MTVKSAQTWTGVVVTKDSTGALATPSVGPAGTLYVNGVSNAASVTVTGSNPYKWSVTLPTLTAGDTVSMYLTATISSVATAAVVAEDTADTKRVSDLNDAAAAPSAASIRTEMDANSTKLANLDATVSSRLASASYTAPDNATMATISTNVSTLLSRLGAFTGSGVNTVLGMLKALGSKSASTPSDMGGTYDASTDSQEAAIDNAVGGSTPAQLWTYASRTLTQSASQVSAAVSGSDITILRGDRVTVNLTGIGSLVGRTKLWITVKWSASQSDGEAVIQAEETAGLLTLNGASYATATDSVITVTDAATGALTWVLKEAATRQLSAPVAGMVYDIQILTSDGPITRAAGSVNTTADVTRAVT